MEKNNKLRPFGLRDKIGYGLGDFGCNMSFAFINNYMMLFYVTCMKINPKHYAIIILLAKIFDAINDPIIGRICDASKPGKDGSKYKKWIKIAALPLLLSSILMFIYVPAAPYAVKVAMCLGLYCVWSVAYTSTNVPYGSMQSVITNVPGERSDLSTFRSIGAMLAQAPVMVVLPMLVYDKNDNPRGNIFIIIVAVMGILGFISFILLRKLTTERIEPVIQEKQSFNYFNTLGAYFKNKPMLGVTISTVAQLALIMTVTTSFQYVFMCYFKSTKLLPVATVIAGCPMVLGIILVKPLSRRFTKKQLCTYPFIISIIASGIATFVRFTNPYIWIIFIGFAMLGMCFYMVLTWAMVADCIDYQAAKTGRREEGSIYATYSLFRKIAQGIGSALIAFALGLTGYDETLDALAQAAGVPEKIYFMTGFLPFIGAIISLVSMHFLYNLSDDPLAGIEPVNKEEKAQ